jgi:hypothetical protein
MWESRSDAAAIEIDHAALLTTGEDHARRGWWVATIYLNPQWPEATQKRENGGP